MKDSQKGRQLHALAEDARERGDFLKALEYTDQATLAYQRDGDYLGLSEVQSSRQSTFKHLYRQTKDPSFLVLEEHAALSAVAIAETSGIPEALGIPYHNLGKYYLEAKRFQEAAHAFHLAVDNLIAHPSKRHSRPSVIADIKGHMYTALYFAGDKSALEKAIAELETLKNADEPSAYSKNAWISGAHLRIAVMAAQENPVMAKEHLKQAKEVIESDDRQILRRQQSKRVEEMFKRLID